MEKTYFGIQWTYKGQTFWLNYCDGPTYSSTPCFPFTSKDYAEMAIGNGDMNEFKNDSSSIVSTEVYVSE